MTQTHAADRYRPGPEFDFRPTTRVVYGEGRLNRIGEFASEVGGTHVLLCTDAGLRAAGHVDRALESLAAAGLKTTVLDDVHPNPTTKDVDHGVAIAKEAKIDMLIGLGGGSSMDCAKGINFVLTNGGRLQDYVGSGKAKLPMLPMIGVPTTAGTGSEAQSYAVIGDPLTHVKMACGDHKAAFRVAILDPELTVSMPKAVTTATGIDAISHAIETFVTTSRNEFSQLYSRRGLRLLVHNLATVLDDPRNLTARGEMLLGANFAGTAIENSMLGATHALSNPLTAKYDTVHGLAIGVLLPHVIRFNATTVAPLYGVLANDLSLCEPNHPEAGWLLADFLSSKFQQAGCPSNLTECGVAANDLAELAHVASNQWTGQFNPRPVDASALEEIYRCAL